MAKHTHRRRSAPLLWVGGAIAAASLVMGVNGTLAGWTSAVIDNNHNSVASAAAYSLKETNQAGTVTCDTSTVADNHFATCDNINKYGGVAGGGPETGGAAPAVTPLSEGGSRSTTVTLLNNGSTSGTLKLTTETCAHALNIAANGGDTANYDLCTQIDVTVACTGGTGVGPVKLSAFTGIPNIRTLAVGASTDCTFTVALPDPTAAGYANQIASQVLHWTLSA